MKLQKAFFLVLGLAFLVSLGSLISGGSNQKALVISGTNSIGLINPTTSTIVSPGQTLPMTCEISTEPGYTVFNLAFTAWSNATGEVVFNERDGVSYTSGSYTQNVTIPSTASGSITMNCIAEYWNSTSQQYRQLASNFPVNVSTTPPTGGDTTAPSVPANFTVTATSYSSLTLNWSPSTDAGGVASYEIFRNNGGSTAINTTTPIATVNHPITTYVNSGLLANKTYKYQIRAKDTAGNNSARTSSVSRATLVIPIPTNVTITNATSSSLTVNWTAPTTPIYQYAVYSNNGGSTAINTTTPIATVPAGTTTYTRTGLNPATSYKFRIASLSDAGSRSYLTTSKTGTTISGTPSDTTAPTVNITAPTASQVLASGTTSTTLRVTTNENATCKWNATNVAYASMTGAMTGSGSTSHSASLTGLTNGTSYTRYVACSDTAGNASSTQSRAFSVASETVVDTTAPTFSGLSATASTVNSITLDWADSTDPSTPVTYKLYRSTSSTGTFTQVGGTLTTSSFIDTNLSASTTYWYKGVACDGVSNCSAQSAAVSRATTAVPDTTAPTATITAPTASQVLPGGTTSTGLSVTTNEPATCKWNTTDVAYASMANTMSGSGSTSHTSSLTGLTNGTSYTRYVRCQDTAGNPMTTSQSRTFSVAVPADTTAPTVPAGLSVANPTTTSLSVSWSASTDVGGSVASYKLYRSTSSTGTFTEIVSQAGLSYLNSGLTSGLTYWYKVSACDNASTPNCSAQSAAVSGTTLSAPSAPTNVSVGSPTVSSLTVSWSTVTGATSYKIYRVGSNGIVDGAVPAITVSAPNLSSVVSGLTSSTTYRFLVTAVNAVGESTLTPGGTNNASGTTSTPQITVSSLQLVRTDGTVIETLDGGETINIGTQNGGVGPNISVKANTNPATPGSVVFSLQKPNSTTYTLTENGSPYTMFGDTSATSFAAWQNLLVGGYTLTVTPYAGTNGTGQVGVPKVVQFQIANNDDTTAPTNPTGVNITYRSATQVKVAWTNSTSTDVSSYKVYRDNVSVGVVAHPTNTFTDTTVNATGNYVYKVSALDASNNEATLPGTGTTAPTLSTVYAINNQVETNTSAQVKSAPESATVAGTQATGSIGTITNGPVWVTGGVQYWYVNFNSGTDGWVNQTNLDVYVAPVTDVTAPVYPGGNASFTVTAGSQTSLVLDWADATDTTPPVTYKVSRSNASNGTFTQVAPAFTASTYTDTEGGALTAGSTRYYKLVACDAVTPTQNCTTAITQSGTTSVPSDTTAPTVTITSPTASQVLSSGTTSTMLSVTTNEAATCRWGTTSSQAYGSMTETFTGTGTTSHTYNLIGLTNGTSYTRYVRCQDTAGNATTSSQSVSFSVANPVDTTSPVTSITSPANNSTVSNTLNITASATDAVGVTNVEFYYGANMISSDNSSPYTASWNTATVTNGSYSLTSKAYDANGNVGTSTGVTVNVSNSVVVDPPVSTTCPTLNTVSGNTLTQRSVQICAEVSNNPNSITLKWANVSSRTQTSADIYRKTGYASTSWGNAIGTASGSTTSWTDTSAVPGQYYEYQVKVNSNQPTAYGYIASGINVPLETYKGKMVLVIDNTFQTSLSSEIQTLIDDLTSDRWVVIPKYVSRTDTPTNVRNQIKAEYDADPTNVKAVYLLGHVPAFAVGDFSGDGHESRGQYTDTPYADMTNTPSAVSGTCYTARNAPSGVWTTDAQGVPTSYNTVTMWNIPFRTTSGYTDYQQYAFGSSVSSHFDNPPTSHRFCYSGQQTASATELQVGRVDMYELMNNAEFNTSPYPQFTSNHVQTVEKQLLSDYLTKAHTFKIKQWAPTKRALSRDLNMSSYEGGKYVWGTFPSLVGPNNMVASHDLNNTNPFNDKLSGDQTYLFLSAFYGGQHTGADAVNGTAVGHSRIMANTGSYEHGGVFNIFIASYFGEWGDANSILRMSLTSGKALATVYGLPQNWFFHSMGLGKDIGYAGKMSINNSASLYQPQKYANWGANGFMTLLGDPSLRMEYIAPVSSLTLSNSGGKTAMSWSSSPDAISGYNVYKITSSSITKLNSTPITTTSFTSTDNYVDGNKYMVTAVKLTTQNNSGTYYNESLGKLSTVGGVAMGDTTPPTTPSNLVIGNSSYDSVTLSWTASSDAVGVSGYNIFRSNTQSGTYTQLNETLWTSTSYDDSSVSPSTTYFYKVSALDAAGNQSSQSSSATTTTQALPTGGGQVQGINGSVGPSLTVNSSSCSNSNGGPTYYIDGVSGNDTNNGTSTSTAWKTIDRMNTMATTASPGTMICFKRGSIYRGTIQIPVSGTQVSPIVVNAYGSGAAPIISGFDAVTGTWTVHSGNIYKTTIATGLTPKQLQVSGSVQKLARHPNTGWLKTENKTSTQTTDDWISTQTANSLVGASIVELANPWAWFKGVVSAQSGSTVTFSPGAAIFTGDQAGWSYGFENKLSFLDSAGEWFYDSTNGNLYLWAPGNANPNNLLVEISSRNYGITLKPNASDADLQFKNLVFEGFSTAVSQDGQQKRVLYENLEMRKSGRALLMWTPSTDINDGNTIRNNYIHDIQQDAVSLFEGNGHTFEGNVVKDVGVDPWLAANSTTWGMIGLNTGTSNQTVRRNKFENIGYTGIFVNGSGLVEENYLENMLVSTTDGAGIMWNVADGLTIRKNIVKDVHSNMDNMPLPYPTYSPIGNAFYYGDDTVKNTTVEGNVAIDIENDAYVMDHGAEYINNKTINNIGFDFGRGGLFFSDASIYRDIGPTYGQSYMQLCQPYDNSACFTPQFNDIVTGNKLYSLNPDYGSMTPSGSYGSRGIYMFYVYSNGAGGHVDYGTINNNYYYNRLSPERVTTRIPASSPFTTTDYTLAEWRSFSGEDMNSTNSSYPASSTRPEPQIFYNATISPITQSVNGCNSNGTALTGVQTIQPFTALVVEYGNC